MAVCQRPIIREATSDPLDFFRGLALAIPLSLLLWGAIFRLAGWLWRGNTSQTLRIGFHYYNGKSNQFEFFDQFEEQIGGGLWYDF